MQEKPRIRVMLVDDHPFVLEGLRACLTSQEQFEIIGEAKNGREAVDKAKELRPSVIIMDISMPIMNGLEATRQLRKIFPEIKVLILTMHEKREFTSQIVQSGARGYVSKNSSPTDLLQAIEAVHSGGTFFTSTLPDLLISNDEERAAKALKTPDLSVREQEVLTLIAEGFSNKEVASLLSVSVRTIEKHRERIMDKLNIHSIVELTKYAIAHRLVQVN